MLNSVGYHLIQVGYHFPIMKDLQVNYDRELFSGYASQHLLELIRLNIIALIFLILEVNGARKRFQIFFFHHFPYLSFSFNFSASPTIIFASLSPSLSQLPFPLLLLCAQSSQALGKFILTLIDGFTFEHLSLGEVHSLSLSLSLSLLEIFLIYSQVV